MAITTLTNKLQNNSRFDAVNYVVLQQADIEAANHEHGNFVASGRDICSSSDDEYFSPRNEQNSKMANQNNNKSIMQNTYNTQQLDLVYSHSKSRTSSILLGIAFAVVVFGLLGGLYYIIFCSPQSESSTQLANNGIHLEDVLTGQLAASRFNGSWSTGSSFIYNDHNQIIEFNVTTRKKTVLLVDEHRQYLLQEKSADGRYLLLAKHFKKNFRYSYEAVYDILETSTGQIKPLTIKGAQKSLSMVQWSPVGNALIINFERNLYYKPSAFAEEIPITNDDNPAILNGIPDWVYEEEVFSSNIAAWFNPDGTMLAFIQFDESPIHVINVPYYGEAGDLRFQYPYNRLIAYPKAGSSNPTVRLFTSDLIGASQGLEHLKPIPVPSALNTEASIITAVSWINNTHTFSVWMNRIQNQAYLQISGNGKRMELYNIESKTGWVDFFTPPFKNDGSRLAFIHPQLQDGGVYYRHLCVIPTLPNSSPQALTRGKYVVQSILHWDARDDIIFYKANTESEPHVLHVYAIKANTGETPTCLTCNLQISGEIKQTYYTADFNSEHEVVISSQGPGIPMHSIYQWSYTNNQVSLKKLMDWETNERLRSKIQKIQMPTTEIHTFRITQQFTAKVLLQLPPNLDRSGNTKYPMLVDVYGGPDSFSVIDKWNMDWGTYLSSNRSIIYAKIDGRGSGLRGDELLHSIYLKLGTVEIFDQIQVAKALQQKFPFIDANHIGIWGWSYGGYAASLALASDNNTIFNCAAAIAPVTDWAYYDSIYTERYMSLPQLNAKGYAFSRLSTQAQQLRGKRYLLVHGTLDDNVHYQQSMILIKNLERHDIEFKQISYPDEDHSLAGVRPHLYHSLDNFFGNCFDKKDMMHSKN